MRNVLISFLLVFFIFSCSTKKESQNVILGADIALDCMLTSPIGHVPNNIYTVGNIEPTEKYPPFTKKLEVCGVTLIARDEISNDFMQNVGNTISEMFTITSDTDLDIQRQVIESLYQYKTVIPLFYGEDWNISQLEESSWDETSSANSLCDIIMEDIPNQVMEVVEHILHHVTDVGLHYTMSDDWGLFSGSELYKVTNDAIISGDDIDDGFFSESEDMQSAATMSKEQEIELEQAMKRSFFDLSVIVEDAETGEEVELPPVRFVRWREEEE